MRSFDKNADLRLCIQIKILIHNDCVKEINVLYKLDLIQEGKLSHNLVKQTREGLLMGKAELVRKAGVSALTISRIEKGLNCRLETKRKIIVVLGYDLSDRDKIFHES